MRAKADVGPVGPAPLGMAQERAWFEQRAREFRKADELARGLACFVEHAKGHPCDFVGGFPPSRCWDLGQRQGERYAVTRRRRLLKWHSVMGGTTYTPLSQWQPASPLSVDLDWTLDALARKAVEMRLVE
jgi:hypothetical protein